MPRIWPLIASVCIVAGCSHTEHVQNEEPPSWQRLVEQRIGGIHNGEITPVLLHQRQWASVSYALYAAPPDCRSQHPVSRVPLPNEEEINQYIEYRHQDSSSAYDYLDEIYFDRDDLKALAIRDTDEDGVPDYRISDYLGKFMEGDIDIDGDGLRNTLDADPYRGESDLASIRAIESCVRTGYGDTNGNAVPDHVDLALRHEKAELAAIQSGLLMDYGILLLERNRNFDLPLAQAVDDAVRSVYRSVFEDHSELPTLRTIAVEDNALIGPIVASWLDDHTSAQVFSQTQSLTVYDEGRDIDHAIGLLGLVVHEIAHSYHMSLDFDASDLESENSRRDFPAENFSELIRQFGWKQIGYYDERAPASEGPVPHYAYIGMAGPEFSYRERTPLEWEEWLLQQFYELEESPDYLRFPVFSDQYIVGDYSLTSPYEWFADSVLAYVVVVLEQHAIDLLIAAGSDSEELGSARRRIDIGMQSIWSDFYHRNINPDLFDYLERTFPILEADKARLSRRYIFPMLGIDTDSASIE